jgi:predicted Zn-dependent protease
VGRGALALAGLVVDACGASPTPTKPPTPAAVTATASPAATPAVVLLDKPARLEAVRPQPAATGKPDAIVELMASELARSMTELGKQPDPPYFASYEVIDDTYTVVAASFGALAHSSEHRGRHLDVDVRVGDYKLDNTHTLNERARDHTRSSYLPFEDDEYAMRSALWLETDGAYQHAVEQLQKVQAQTKVKAEAEDKSDDFSHEQPSQYYEPARPITIDRKAWEQRLRAASALFRKYPQVTSSAVALTAMSEMHYYVSSDGTRYQAPYTHVRVMISAEALADDGMKLHRFEAFDVATPDRAPTDDQIAAKVALVAHDLAALRTAPLAEPYIGPAVLEGKAAGVFFHEVFGHRIEGHRQKNESEGQTFAKKIGQQIMPSFIDVFDDPTIATLDGVDLNGFFRYDDEGTPAQRASLVEHGVLKTFLLGRSPTRGFVHSNGHGRRSAGYSVVARQGNLIVAPTKTVDRATLQGMLLDEVKAQGKPYGLVFRELDGGFTMTERFSPQAFKLLPIMVYRAYPDGRLELVRGADLEGTPLEALGDIVAAGDDVDTFNGFCGAESGFVPVAASSPSLLVSHIEVAKKAKTNDKPPILPAPALEHVEGGAP